jgi:dipeptidyl aminopeptidase/acylaminoacyl peptidase
MLRHRLYLVCLAVALFAANLFGADNSATHSLSFTGERHKISLPKGNAGFVILPRGNSGKDASKRPWVWYAPTFSQPALPGKELEWLFPRLLDAGFAIAGIEVGESYGNPAGREVFTQFHKQIVKQFKLSPKASLLPQSRGGLMLYNWAAEHPKNVQCIGGIYTVCDLRSYPGLDKAAPAYGMTADELAAHLSEHNPIDRLRPLVKSKVPIFHIHGDADKLVPLEKNAGELVTRYQQLGGQARLVVVHGKGHEVCPEFFQSQALLDFFLQQAQPKK